jgi:hypothetical protein
MRLDLAAARGRARHRLSSFSHPIGYDTRQFGAMTRSLLKPLTDNGHLSVAARDEVFPVGKHDSIVARIAMRAIRARRWNAAQGAFSDTWLFALARATAATEIATFYLDK